MRLPGAPDSASDRGRSPWPDPDDHLVEPETRQEMWRGQLIELSPARPEHGDTHTRLDRVVDQYTADGYVASTDLLTRRSEDSDFATDTSVRKDGDDPETGSRYLEELCFEVFHTQSRAQATRRARDVIRSGVRRMFGLFVRPVAFQNGSSQDSSSQDSGSQDSKYTVTVEEWSEERDDWLPCDAGDYIHDPCLVRPLAIKALIDTAAADDACAHGLIARRNPIIKKLERTHRVKGYRQGEENGYRKGKDDGARSLASSVLTQHFGELPDWASRRVATAGFDELQRWVTGASAAASLEDLLVEEPEEPESR